MNVDLRIDENITTIPVTAIRILSISNELILQPITAHCSRYRAISTTKGETLRASIIHWNHLINHETNSTYKQCTISEASMAVKMKPTPWRRTTFSPVKHLSNFLSIWKPSTKAVEARPLHPGRSHDGTDKQTGGYDDPFKNKSNATFPARWRTSVEEALERPAHHEKYGHHCQWAQQYRCDSRQETGRQSRRWMWWIECSRQEFAVVADEELYHNTTRTLLQ